MLCLAQAIPAYGFRTVIIDAGHGGADPGAFWYGIKEKNLTLDVAKRVEVLLRKNGVRTVMTRRSDRTMTLRQRAELANRYRNALFVSIHFNASRKVSTRGHETYYCSSRGKVVASRIQRHMKDFVSSPSRGTKYRRFSVLRNTSATAVLVECAFLSNRGDARKCLRASYRQQLALGIARGILRSR